MLNCAVQVQIQKYKTHAYKTPKTAGVQTIMLKHPTKQTPPPHPPPPYPPKKKLLLLETRKLLLLVLESANNKRNHLIFIEDYIYAKSKSSNRRHIFVLLLF